MNINFELYRVFYEVAKTGNITKASQSLMISQPAVSKHIKHLEQDLDATLFIRSKKGVTLTENGRTLYKYINQAMTSIQKAETSIEGLKNKEFGTVRIGVSTTLSRYFLLSHLQQFHEKYPNISIEIFTDPTSFMIQDLKQGNIDFILCKIPERKYPDIDTTILDYLHPVFIVGKPYKSLSLQKIPLEMLTEYPLLLPKNCSTTRIMIDHLFLMKNITLHPSMEIASASLLIDFVKIGFGVGIATKEYIRKELNSKKLFVVKTTPSLPRKPFGILKAQDHILSFGAEKLIEMLTNKK